MADACIDGQKRLKEKKQAETDKAEDVTSEMEAGGVDLKPGERKVISDGSQGPIVEIIRKSGDEAADSKPAEEATPGQTGE